MESSGINLALKGEGKKSISLFLVITSLWLLYILLITLTIAYLISFYSSLAVFPGRKGEITFPKCFCFASSFVHQAACKRAGNHRRSSSIFPEPARSGHHNFPSSQEASESIFQVPLHEHWDPGVFLDSMACCCCFLLFFSFLSLPFSCSSAD